VTKNACSARSRARLRRSSFADGRGKKDYAKLLYTAHNERLDSNWLSSTSKDEFRPKLNPMSMLIAMPWHSSGGKTGQPSITD